MNSISQKILFDLLDEFFEDGASDKVVAMNKLLSAYMYYEGFENNLRNKSVVADTHLEAVKIIDFMVTCREAWERHKLLTCPVLPLAEKIDESERTDT